MRGVLKCSQQMLDSLAGDLAMVVEHFVGRGILYKVDKDNGQVYMLLDHPDFTDPDKDTEYLLYFGNRYDRLTARMMPRLLHLDKIGAHGRLEPVRYYET